MSPPTTPRAAYERVLAKRASATRRTRASTACWCSRWPQPGREVILGVNRDPRWGPLLMVGLGGVRSRRSATSRWRRCRSIMTPRCACSASLKGAQMLGAYRGAPPADTDALAELMVRLSHFAADHADDIAEIDLNPVIVHARGEGVSVVDA